MPERTAYTDVCHARHGAMGTTGQQTTAYTYSTEAKKMPYARNEPGENFPCSEQCSMQGNCPDFQRIVSLVPRRIVCTIFCYDDLPSGMSTDRKMRGPASRWPAQKRSGMRNLVDLIDQVSIEAKRQISRILEICLQKYNALVSNSL